MRLTLGQIRIKGVSGVWKDLISNINTMSNNLSHHVNSINRITECVVKVTNVINKNKEIRGILVKLVHHLEISIKI